MTPTQRQAAVKAATETLTRLLETAPDYGEVGVTLTFHNSELRSVVEMCKRMNQRGQ
ncbi:MAG: hypothetical protein Ta2A_07620 [Treponemataceae bacterium]|nr:MAG: hypothetical protein Ta2A_07620 [Treponemataceae bacterium]